MRIFSLLLKLGYGYIRLGLSYLRLGISYLRLGYCHVLFGVATFFRIRPSSTLFLWLKSVDTGLKLVDAGLQILIHGTKLPTYQPTEAKFLVIKGFFLWLGVMGMLCMGVALASVALAATPQVYQAQELDYQAVEVTSGLRQPWSMVFLPDGSSLVAEKGGDIWQVQSSGEKARVGSIEAAVVRGQGGLMDLTLAPDFASSAEVYYSYTAREGNRYGTRVGRFVWRDARVQEQQEIFRAANESGGGRHFGSRLVFDAAGYLYLGLGDRGVQRESQNLANHFGTVLRLDVAADGQARPVAANPFAQDRFIYSYGHRNPQGMVYAAGNLWLHEHGARGGDELNLVSPGRNYGWPVITYGRDYSGLKIGEGTHKEGMEQPLVYWDPSIAPSGMILYQGDKFPAWQGDIFIGALAGTHLRRVDMQQDTPVGQEVLLEHIGRVREVAEDAEGYIYILTDARDGKMFRLEPAEQ